MSNINQSTSLLNVGGSSYITASQRQSPQHQFSHQNVTPPVTVQALEEAKQKQESFPSTASNLSALHSTGQNSDRSVAIGTMPDGTSVHLQENMKSRLLDGKFLFHDPQVKSAHKTGTIEFDAEITSGCCVDLKNIFNNSYKKGALDLVIWHVTKNREEEEFKITGIANDDLYAICAKKYGMENTAKEVMSGNLATVREKAIKRLVDKGWTLFDKDVSRLLIT